jgi:hypothetical protein
MKNLEELWGRIASVTKDEVITAVLNDEILLAKSRLQPHDTGHLHDYISRLTDRLDEIKGDKKS